MISISKIDVRASADDLRGLWREVFRSRWPVPTVELINEYCDAGFAAFEEDELVGAVLGTDEGSIRCAMVHPDHTRSGTGRRLIDAFVAHLSNLGAEVVELGSGGAGSYFWPGVPVDDFRADGFFEKLGWTGDATVIDLTQDLGNYEPRREMRSRAAAAGIEISILAEEAQRNEVIHFERLHFPHWEQWYVADFVDFDQILAGTRNGKIVGAVTLEGPASIWPLEGEMSCAIGAVGVDPALHGQGIGTAMMDVAAEVLSKRNARYCHIGWVERVDFYRRLGYEQSRQYRMMKKSIST